MKFIDFFAGIGGFHSSLENAGHEMVGWVEWDKFARQSYEAMYDTEGKYTANDIKSIKDGKELPEADLWAFGSPCTNISVAGSRVGLKGEQSSMFFEVIRLLNDRSWEEKPSYLLMENVKNLLGSNKGFDFFRVLYEMDEAGYDVEWEVFNSSWTIPQNRERVYIVGHKRGIEYKPVFPINRGELEKNRKYNVLRDVLETSVDSKFYLPKDKVEQLLVNDKKSTFLNTGKVKIFGNTSNTGRIYDESGLSPTLNTMQGGGREPKVLVEPCLTPDRVNKRQNGRRFKNNDEPSFTLTAADRHGILLSNGKTYVIRKLTPLECWRLQGFTDEQFNKAKEAGVSNSQLYKQAGNAVTIPVVEAIGEKLNEKLVKE